MAVKAPPAAALALSAPAAAAVVVVAAAVAVHLSLLQQDAAATEVAAAAAAGPDLQAVAAAARLLAPADTAPCRRPMPKSHVYTASRGQATRQVADESSADTSQRPTDYRAVRAFQDTHLNRWSQGWSHILSPVAKLK
eukprot:GHUV01012425.1.p1 GENE.GHUV01012425.1~~GHUV01012425.1.p1  ORF type:complete len:138 (-),score=47.80 GHUV01012425.1:572-985(-)